MRRRRILRANAAKEDEMEDFKRYLARIDLPGVASLKAMHLAHATSIPFENLDPVRGLPISLDAADLESKLVSERRGGYCFEQNLLFLAALEHLGDDSVEPILARVRTGGRPGPRPRTHLILKVKERDQTWHVDV